MKILSTTCTYASLEHLVFSYLFSFQVALSNRSKLLGSDLIQVNIFFSCRVFVDWNIVRQQKQFDIYSSLFSSYITSPRNLKQWFLIIFLGLNNFFLSIIELSFLSSCDRHKYWENLYYSLYRCCTKIACETALVWEASMMRTSLWTSNCVLSFILLQKSNLGLI